MAPALISKVRDRYHPDRVFPGWSKSRAETPSERFCRDVGARWEKAAEDFLAHLAGLERPREQEPEREAARSSASFRRAGRREMGLQLPSPAASRDAGAAGFPAVFAVRDEAAPSAREPARVLPGGGWSEAEPTLPAMPEERSAAAPMRGSRRLPASPGLPALQKSKKTSPGELLPPPSGPPGAGDAVGGRDVDGLDGEPVLESHASRGGPGARSDRQAAVFSTRPAGSVIEDRAGQWGPEPGGSAVLEDPRGLPTFRPHYPGSLPGRPESAERLGGALRDLGGEPPPLRLPGLLETDAVLESERRLMGLLEERERRGAALREWKETEF